MVGPYPQPPQGATETGDILVVTGQSRMIVSRIKESQDTQPLAAHPGIDSNLAYITLLCTLYSLRLAHTRSS
jgi:hypothetical protein